MSFYFVVHWLNFSSARRFTLNDVRNYICCLSLAVSEEMTIGCQGSLRCRVSDHSRNGGRVYSSLYLKRYEQVPECVYTIEREVSAFTLMLEPWVWCSRMHRSAVPLGEQPVVFLPLVTKLSLVAVLVASLLMPNSGPIYLHQELCLHYVFYSFLRDLFFYYYHAIIIIKYHKVRMCIYGFQAEWVS